MIVTFVNSVTASVTSVTTCVQNMVFLPYRFHQKKFSVFCRMYKDQLRYKKMMEEELS